MAEHSINLELFYAGGWQRVPVLDTPNAEYRRGATTVGNDTDPADGSAVIDNTSGLYAPRSPASLLYGLIGQNTPARLSADGSVRMAAEVSKWSPGRPVKGSGSTPVDLSGILRRLGRGTDPRFESPLRRSYDNDPGALVAYWPLEEPRGADTAYDTLTGSPSKVGGFTGLVSGNAGAPQFGVVDAGPGSAPIANLAGGWNLDLNLPPVAATGQVSFECTTAFGTTVRNIGVQTMGIRLSPYVNAKHLQFSIGVFDDGTVNLRWLEADRNFALLAGPTVVYSAGGGVRNIFDGQPRVFALDLTANGGTNVDWVLWENDANLASGTITPSFAGAMNAPPWRASANSTNAADVESGWGHVAVWNQTNVTLRVPALNAHRGELATDRFTRLCGEEGVTAAVVGDPADAIAMGVQGTGPMLDQLDEIARTDDASIFETRAVLGLTMRTGASKQNQAPALTVSYLGHVRPPLLPVFGDAGIRNAITARNVDGSSVTAVQLTGPNNVQAPGTDPQGVGRYPTNLDVSTDTVDALRDAAGRRLAQGTYDGTWYASVTVDLDAAPQLTAAVNAVDIGDCLALVNLPVEEALDTVESIVIGISERYPPKQRWVTFYLIPAEPYRVGKLANDVGDTDPLLGREGPDGSTTAATVAAGAASFTVATPAGPLWSTAADDVPVDVLVGGQRVTISAIAGAASPQTFTVQPGGRPVRYRVAAGAAVTVQQPIILAP